MNNFNNDSEDYFVSLKEKVTQFCSDWLLLLRKYNWQKKLYW
jgi:hypothetical protein